MKFTSREEAGRRLGLRLLEQGIKTDLVLGLPRGGVVIGAAVADILRRPLDVLIVRKIGHPGHREFAVGALAEPDVVILDDAALLEYPVMREQLNAVLDEERARLQAYRLQFHRSPAPVLNGKAVLLVDDGLATGATARAAVISARQQGARNIVIAAPVASPEAADRLRREADAVVVLLTDPDFGAVGQYYQAFPQVEDDEVIALLRQRISSVK